MRENLIKVRNLRFAYRDKPVLKGISFDVALMGALCRTPLFSSFSAADKKLAEQALEKMGIAHLKNAPYTKVSGGELSEAEKARLAEYFNSGKYKPRQGFMHWAFVIVDKANRI